MAAAYADLDEDELDGLEDEDLDDLDGITELVEYSPSRVDAVANPANGTPWLLMKRAGGGRAAARAVGRVLKADGEKRFTLAIAYPALKPDITVAQDGQRDFASPSANEAAAWSFMKSGARIGVMHADGTEGAGTCVESHVHRGPDLAMTAADGTQQVIRDGDWIVGVIWDPDAWQAIKQGRFTGLSMQGSARRAKPSKEALRSLRKQAAAPALPPPPGLRRLGVGKQGKRLVVLDRNNWPCAIAKNRKQAARLWQEYDAPASVKQARKAARRVVPARLAAGGPVAAGALEKARRPKCKNCGKRAGHPESTFCTRCGHRYDGGGVAKSGTAVLTGAEQIHLAALLRKAADPATRVDAIGELAKELGPAVAARIVAGDALSAEEFRRAYLGNGRANQSAAPGQEPRIPSVRPVSPEDFQRGPLPPPQSRPSPETLLQRLAGPGQQAFYGSRHGGTGTLDSRAGLGNTGTGPSTAIPATAGMGRAPAPGGARPW